VLSVYFDMCFHFIDQWMHAFMLAVKATSEVFVSVMFASNSVVVKNEISKMLRYR